MNIVGINGWNSWFHDSSICIVRDNKLVFACEQERFSRTKHTSQAPCEALERGFKEQKLTWSDIDQISIGWDVPFYSRYFSNDFSKEYCTDIIRNELGIPKTFPITRIKFTKHHVAHALSGLILTPLDQQCLLLVLDGQGEQDSITIFRYSLGDLHVLDSYSSEYSLGYFYEAASKYIGLNLTDTGKFMGLSGYGTPKYSFSKFENLITANSSKPTSDLVDINISEDLDDAKRIVDSYWIPEFHNIEPRAFNHSLKLDERNKLASKQYINDFASSVQFTLERVIRHLVLKYINKNDESIVITGGVGLNCKSNGELLRALNQKIYIQPLANDAGVSLGAAISILFEKQRSLIDLTSFPYIGPEYSEKEILSELQRSNQEFEYTKFPWLSAARLISEGKVIGWFQGKAEVGPRALGARSILARADSKELRNHININIKQREIWRPFSPAILAELAPNYFEMFSESPYMLFSFKALSELTNRHFAGTLHIDSSARVQTVNKNCKNTPFRKLIEEVYKLTSIPGVLNTSFNAYHEPIVNSPLDAIKTFMSSNLDALIIGNFIVKRSSL